MATFEVTRYLVVKTRVQITGEKLLTKSEIDDVAEAVGSGLDYNVAFDGKIPTGPSHFFPDLMDAKIVDTVVVGFLETMPE